MRLDEISLAKFFTKVTGVNKDAEDYGIIPEEMRKLIVKHFPGSNALTKEFLVKSKSGFLFDSYARADFNNIIINFTQPNAGPLVANVQVFLDAKRRGDMKSPPIKRVKYTIRSEADLEQIKKDYPKQ